MAPLFGDPGLVYDDDAVGVLDRRQAVCDDEGRASDGKSLLSIPFPQEKFIMTSSASTDQLFAGKVAIVTGAASGIGLATTELLHAQGATVIAVDRGANVEALAQPGIVPLIADVAHEESAVRAVSTATERFGRLDILQSGHGLAQEIERRSEAAPFHSDGAQRGLHALASGGLK